MSNDLSGIGGEKRPGIVHRLDRGTSGLMVIAKNDAAHEELARQFHDREVEKEYVALVWGVVQAGRRIDAPIGRDPANRKKMSARARRSREAVTRIIRADHLNPALTLAQIAIHTGRTHQIRVHLSAIGHPMVGDSLYGGVHRRVPADMRAVMHLQRPFLHAARLVFKHPADGRRMEFTSELPDELAAGARRIAVSSRCRGAKSTASALQVARDASCHRFQRPRVLRRSRSSTFPQRSGTRSRHRATPSSVVIVPMRDDGQVMLIRQYRRERRPRAVGSAGGTVSTPAKALRRRRSVSARKRSGWSPRTLERIRGLYPAPGFCDEELIFFRVSDLVPPAPDSHAQAGRGRGHPRRSPSPSQTAKGDGDAAARSSTLKTAYALTLDLGGSHSCPRLDARRSDRPTSISSAAASTSDETGCSASASTSSIVETRWTIRS